MMIIVIIIFIIIIVIIIIVSAKSSLNFQTVGTVRRPRKTLLNSDMEWRPMIATSTMKAPKPHSDSSAQ